MSTYDVIVIGSGFGGTMAAESLVRRGHDVLMLERGRWVERGPENWSTDGILEHSEYFETEPGFIVNGDGSHDPTGICACVGGASVFYGGVSLRFRETDFEHHPEISGESGARWPIGYEDLEPHYDHVERLLHVAGEAGADPLEPTRSSPYPQALNGLAPTSERLAASARAAGLEPFRLPLAINFSGTGGNGGPERSACVECDTCDQFPCAVQAKNDLATQVLPALARQGLELRSRTMVTRLVEEGGGVGAVECVDRDTGERYREEGRMVVLAAGALGTPHLLLASGLERANPAGDVVGRYLTRHCTAIAWGMFPGLPDHGTRFHKQIGIHDFYLGDPELGPSGKLGNLQQIQSPSDTLVEAWLSQPWAWTVKRFSRRAVGLMALAEDQPRYENEVTLGPAPADDRSLPRPVIHYRHSDRDLAARDALLARAKELLGDAGALLHYVHEIDTFSHALGTVRMGDDPDTAPLTPRGRFQGMENLYVTDGSAFPTSGGVNPSLTIAANASRVADHIAERLGTDGDGGA